MRKVTEKSMKNALMYPCINMVLKDDLKTALDLSVYLHDPLFFYLDGVKNH